MSAAILRIEGVPFKNSKREENTARRDYRLTLGHTYLVGMGK